MNMPFSPRRRHVRKLLGFCAALALVLNLPLGVANSMTQSRSRDERRRVKSKTTIDPRGGMPRPPSSMTQTLDAMPLNERVLVVYNANEPESLEVANYYMTRRNIPTSRKCAVSPSSDTYLAHAEFLTAIKAPVQQCLDAVGRQNILYIVNSYKVPFEIGEIPPPTDEEVSVGRSLDQHVADIWDEIGTSTLYNPYYAEQESQGYIYLDFTSLADYRSRLQAVDVHAVWRREAESAALAKGLVDKAISAEPAGLRGRGCFDRNRGYLSYLFDDVGYFEPDWNIFRAAEFTRERGIEV